jgi:hypothetical protein
VDASMDGWMDEWMDGWMDGTMNGRMNRWMDGCMHECTYTLFRGSRPLLQKMQMRPVMDDKFQYEGMKTNTRPIYSHTTMIMYVYIRVSACVYGLFTVTGPKSCDRITSIDHWPAGWCMVPYVNIIFGAKFHRNNVTT